MLTSLRSPWHPHRKTRMTLPYDADIIRHYIPVETADGDLAESRALGVDGILGSGVGADAADPTWTAWPRALTFGGDDRVEIADAPVSLAAPFTVMAAVKIHDGSDVFDARSLAGVTNLAAEYGVQVDVGCNLRWAVPATFPPNNWTMSAWFIPDWDYDDGHQHCLLDLYLGVGSRVMFTKNAGTQLTCYLVNGVDTYAVALVVPFVAGTPTFWGVRFCGGVLTAYADTNGDTVLETDVEMIPDPLTAGSYSAQVGAQYGSSVHVEGAVNLLITDNGGSANPITDRFNAGAGMALAGDDGWMARHGKNLVLHVGGNAAGTAIQAETYSAATDMLAGTATGRVDISSGNYLTTADPGAGADGLTAASWGIAWESDEVAVSPVIVGRWDTADNQFLVARVTATGIRVYVSDAGNDAANYVIFAVPQSAGARYKGIVTYNAGTLALYYATYDSVTGRYGAVATAAPTVTGVIPVALRGSALGYTVGAAIGSVTFDGKLDDIRIWNGKALTAAEAAADLINEPNPAGLTYWWPFDGNGTEMIAGLTATWTGTPAYVDDGRHGKGAFERWTRNGARYFDGVNDTVSFGEVKALNGAVAFAKVVYFKTSTMAPAAAQVIEARWDVADDSKKQYQISIGATAKLTVTLWDGAAAAIAEYATALASDTWYMAWVLFDGAGAADADRLKVGLASLEEESGRLITPAEVTLAFSGSAIPAYVWTPVGATNMTAGSNNDAAGYFKGLIDDTRLWVSNVPTIAQLNACLPTDERDWGTQSGAPYPDHWWTLSESAGGATTYDRQYNDTDCPTTKIIRPTFARADTGTQIYADQVVRAAASGELRNKHFMRANDSADYLVTLLERAYTNKMTAALADWTPTNIVITSVAEADPGGGTTAALLTADIGNAVHEISFASDTAIGPLSGEVWLKPGTHDYAALSYYNATDGVVNRAAINLTTGALLASEGLAGYTRKIGVVRADDWIRLRLFGSSQVTVDSLVYVNLCDATGTASWDAAGTETIYVWRPTLYEELVPPESVLAASEATTADSLTTPLSLTTPQEATHLYEGVVCDLANQGTARTFANLGNGDGATAGIRLYHEAAAARLVIAYHNGVSEVTGYWTVTLALVDQIAVRFHQAASGAIDSVGLSVNGAAEDTTLDGAFAATLALPVAWNANVVAFAGANATANSGCSSWKSASGAEKSLATMRAMAQPDIAHYHPGMQLADVDGTVTGALQWYDGRIPADLTLSDVERIGRGRYLARKTFSRAGVARYYDGVDYLTRTAPAGHLRDNHSWTANDGVTYRTTLLGRAYINLVTSDDLAAWTEEGTCGVTAGQGDPLGGTGAYLLTGSVLGADARSRIIGFTGDATKALSFYIRAGTAPVSALRLYDANTPAWRHDVTVTWTAGVPVLSTAVGAGVLFSVQPAGRGYYQVAFNAAGVLGANANFVFVCPGVGTMYLYRANAFNDAIPPQDILDASEVRAADSFVDAYSALPQAATYLVEGIVGDLPNQGTARTFWNLGNGAGATAAIRLYYEAAAARLVIAYHNGVSEVTGYWTVALALSDRYSVRFHQAASGAIDAVGLSVNGTAEDTTLDGAFGGTLALPVAWASAQVAYAGTNATANSAHTKCVSSSGAEKSLATMQALLETDASCLYMYVPGQYTDRGTYSMWMQSLTESSAYASPAAVGTTEGLWQMFRTRLRELYAAAAVYTTAGGNYMQSPLPGVALSMNAYGVRETSSSNRTMRPWCVNPGFGYWDDLTWYQIPLAAPSVANRGVPTRVIWSASVPGAIEPYIYLALTTDEKFKAGVRNDAGTVYSSGNNTAPGIGYRSVAITWDMTTLTVYVDGAAEGTTGAPAGTTTLTEQTLGAIRLAITGHGHDDDIGDVIEWARALDPADVVLAHAQLKRLYPLLV
ncbi:MAG TPA: hypothetical protein VNA25_08215 [Phycisphaerae bacterium]|nr:hypothetical protein [Phycisphaerae bacterium]